MPGPREIAESFSSHRFEDALPWLAADAIWTLVGGEVFDGAASIRAACRATAAGLVDVATNVTRFDVIDGGDTVVVDSVTTYTGAGGDATTVASCDLYGFQGGCVVSVRSYTVEVGTPMTDTVS